MLFPMSVALSRMSASAQNAFSNVPSLAMCPDNLVSLLLNVGCLLSRMFLDAPIIASVRSVLNACRREKVSLSCEARKLGLPPVV